MDILFVNPQDKMTLRNEVNGQLLLGTLLLKDGFDVDILRFCQIDGYKGNYETFIHNAVQTIAGMNPKTVNFYSLWPDYHITLRIAKELKAARRDIYVILAGPQAAATVRETLEAMPFVDAVCTGEGEETVVPFFTALIRNGGEGLKDIPGLYFRENGKVFCPKREAPLCDLNTLPHWDDRLYLKHYQNSEENYASPTYYMPIDAGRGCPFKCTFCYANTVRKRSYRLKSPERIVEDIRFFKEKFGITSFWFTHDAYTVNKKLVEQVCDYLIQEKMNITWRCTSRLDCIDKQLIAKMKRAGLTGIEVGVETGSLRMQKLIHKNLDLEMVRENVRYVVEQGITLSTFFMYGLPEETEQDMFDTVQMALDFLDLGVGHVSMSLCNFNPTTEITERFFDKLVLSSKVDSMTRDVYAYKNEFETIASNKALFPYYYNLETPLREKYQYLVYFLKLYETFSASARYFRQAFGGDTRKMVCAFFDENRERLTCGIDVARNWFKERPLDLLFRTLKRAECQKMEQVKAMLQFDYDRNQLRRGKEDSTIVKEYAFCYSELKQKKPLSECAEGSSRILFQKKNGKVGILLLQV